MGQLTCFKIFAHVEQFSEKTGPQLLLSAIKSCRIRKTKANEAKSVSSNYVAECMDDSCPVGLNVPRQDVSRKDPEFAYNKTGQVEQWWKGNMQSSTK